MSGLKQRPGFKEWLEIEGWVTHSSVVNVDNKSSILVRCRNPNHEFHLKDYQHWRDGDRCPQCNDSGYYNYHQEFDVKNFELVSPQEQIITRQSNVFYKCKVCNTAFSSSILHFRKYIHNCLECNDRKEKSEIDMVVIDSIIEQGNEHVRVSNSQ
jgi:RNA polymerase-binding transcription factor DksA